MNGPDGASAARAASCDRPAPPGSLVERELSAVRLTEGLMRFVLCRGRYLHPLRHGAKYRATSPYAGEASPFGNVFTMPEQLDHALPSPQGEGLKVRVLRHHRAAIPGLCSTSSLVCFCITCQAFFLSARKPASAPCAARISRTAQPPSRTQPQTRTRPHRVRRSPALTPRAQPKACTCTGRICRKSGFPQSLHRLFHNFAGFPQRLSFPLAFFERDRVRYAYAVRSYCAVRPGLVWSGMVGYGTVPRYFCATSRVTGGPRHSGHIQSQTR